MATGKISMHDAIIREMTKNDIPEVTVIERMSFSAPWSETSFFNEIYNPRSTSKVAVAGERVIGYICANQVSDEGHILNLGVHPDFRRKGIAKNLVTLIIEELKESACRFLYLEVRESNYPAKKLYEGFGFRIIGTRKEYYVMPAEDAVIMMLKI
ncbi:MAG: ribosomal protein S18-alanine N-acetyltransferase [Nitrospirae bacterium]|nr:ribosomal protein S18-alanine N-acetyltransferase [Nitrospirota bacterium]